MSDGTGGNCFEVRGRRDARRAGIGEAAGRREFALKTLNTYDNNKEETLGMVMMMILVACQLELL